MSRDFGEVISRQAPKKLSGCSGKDARLDGQGVSFCLILTHGKKQRNGCRFAAAILPAPIFHERMA